MAAVSCTAKIVELIEGVDVRLDWTHFGNQFTFSANSLANHGRLNRAPNNWLAHALVKLARALIQTVVELHCVCDVKRHHKI
jgi:hypothetical protein